MYFVTVDCFAVLSSMKHFSALNEEKINLENSPAGTNNTYFLPEKMNEQF